MTAAPLDNRPLMTVAGVCKHLAISRATLYRLIDDGSIRPLHISKTVRFKPADVDAFIESCRTEPGARVA